MTNNKRSRRGSNSVAGRVGDVSGRVGDVSGRVGDVSGRVGDVSGGVEGRIGDVSGGSTLKEVKDFLLQDRGDDDLDCLTRKVRRLENEILGIAGWLDLRLLALEQTAPEVQDVLDDLEERVANLEDLPARVAALEARANTTDLRLGTLEIQVGDHERRITDLEGSKSNGGNRRAPAPK